jgi:hypothetical protein
MYLILQKYSIKDEYFVCDDIFGPKLSWPQSMKNEKYISK